MVLFAVVSAYGSSSRSLQPRTSIIDGCRLINCTKPPANALVADLRTSQWLRYCGTCSGLLAYESHQSRYGGPKKAPSMSKTRGFRHELSAGCQINRVWRTASPTFSSTQPAGIARMGRTTRGSHKVPAFPVMQHRFPSRRLIPRCTAGSSGGSGRASVVARGCWSADTLFNPTSKKRLNYRILQRRASQTPANWRRRLTIGS